MDTSTTTALPPNASSTPTSLHNPSVSSASPSAPIPHAHPRVSSPSRSESDSLRDASERKPLARSKRPVREESSEKQRAAGRGRELRAMEAAEEEPAFEEDPNSRFVDYSCATAWEFLVTDIETVLKKWDLSGTATQRQRQRQRERDRAAAAAALLQRRASEPETEAIGGGGARLLRSAATTGGAGGGVGGRGGRDMVAPLSLGDQVLELSFLSQAATGAAAGAGPTAGAGDSAAAGEGSGGADAELEDSMDDPFLDFNDSVHPFVKWFGLTQFVVLAPPQQSIRIQDGIFRAAFSALHVAMFNVRCLVPGFCAARPLQLLAEHSMIMGVSVPRPGSHNVIHFESALEAPVELTDDICSLDTLLRIFEAKLNLDNNLALMQAEALRADVDAKIVVNVRERYTWKQPSRRPEGIDTLSPSPSTPEQQHMARPRQDSRPPDVEAAIAALVEDLAAPVGAATGSLRLVVPPCTLHSLSLYATWINLRQNLIVDNSTYSVLRPSTLAPEQWVVHTTMSVSAGAAAAPAGRSSSGSGQSRRSSSTSAAGTHGTVAHGLRHLTALYVAAKALRGGVHRPFSEIAQQNEQARAEVFAVSSAMASVLSMPTQLAMQRFLQPDAEPNHEFTNGLLARLFAQPHAMSHSAEHGGDADAAGRGDTAGERRSLFYDVWQQVFADDMPQGRKTFNTVGQLASLLSVYLANVHNVQDMVQLWNDVLRELRNHWEQRFPLPRMHAAAPGEAEDAEEEAKRQVDTRGGSNVVVDTSETPPKDLGDGDDGSGDGDGCGGGDGDGDGEENEERKDSAVATPPTPPPLASEAAAVAAPATTAALLPRYVRTLQRGIFSQTDDEFVDAMTGPDDAPEEAPALGSSVSADVRAAEEALHHLETMDTGTLAAELIAATYPAALFSLAHEARELARVPSIMQALIDLRHKMTANIRSLREEEQERLGKQRVVSANTSASLAGSSSEPSTPAKEEPLERTEAVNQALLRALDEVCTCASNVHRMIARASVLEEHLGPHWALIDRLCHADTSATELWSAEEQQAVAMLILQRQRVGAPEGAVGRELGMPDAREFVLRCECPNPFMGALFHDSYYLGGVVSPLIHRMYVIANGDSRQLRAALAVSESES